MIDITEHATEQQIIGWTNQVLDEIAVDIETLIVPATVASFSELHDYVDANDYCSDIPFLEDTDEPFALIAEVQDRVDAVLKARANA